MKLSTITLSFLFVAPHSFAAEYHVSPMGLDSNPGSNSKPFRSISAAAAIAQPGDAITVHEGTYREYINPPRGGASNDRRITYQAAPGEKVVIKGSEPVKGWKKVTHDTWKVVLPNSFFGDYNPYKIRIHGDWFRPLGGENRKYHTGSVYLNGHWQVEAASKDQVLKPADTRPLWFGEVGAKHTTIYAQFNGLDPNTQNVEINTREAIFYPQKTGINFITVRGFTLEHAAPNWAPPTAEQVGLIGTHWSKGWIIENNTVRYSICTGITLGKHGDEFDNTSANSANGYVLTINRAFKHGWSKKNIGHHIVRNNHISHCEQAGIVGSLGAIFSTVTRNTVHDINNRGMFSGAEMGGIKFHGAIDSVISHNHLYRCSGLGGIWLDWMAQGTRVTGNLLHDNSRDLYMEVNHGPFMVDHNLFLSAKSLRDWSQGGTYAHNLFAGTLSFKKNHRKTPYFKPHSLDNMKLSNIQDKDLRFYNNLFDRSRDLSSYTASGNLFLDKAKFSIIKKSNHLIISLPALPENSSSIQREIVTTKLLGKAKVPDALFEQANGDAYQLDTDYSGKKRNTRHPALGPFIGENHPNKGLKVWPKE